MPIRRLASFLSPSLLLNSHTKAELTNYSLRGARQRQTIDHHHLLYSNPINQINENMSSGEEITRMWAYWLVTHVTSAPLS